MWSGRVEPFEGRHYRLAEPLSNPAPLTRPHPPIMIGGNGERRTLRLVARYADACNLLVPDPGESRRKLAVLREHCQAIGRNYDLIEKTSLIEADLRDGAAGLRRVIDRLRGQSEEGIEHVIVNLPNAEELGPLEAFGREVIPALSA